MLSALLCIINIMYIINLHVKLSVPVSVNFEKQEDLSSNADDRFIYIYVHAVT